MTRPDDLDPWWAEPTDAAPEPPVAPRTGGLARVAGVLGLAAVALLGLGAGWNGAIELACLYVGLTALYAVFRRRSWLGPMRRGAAGGLLAASLVVLVAVTSVAAPPSADLDAAPTAQPSVAPPVPSVTSTPTLADRTVEPPRPDPAPTVDAGAVAGAQPQTALATAALLPVKGRAPKTGYDRDLYGHAWKDVDRNGCDTRNDILRRDLVDQRLKDGTNGCVVASGTLNDPYSARPIAFLRGQDTSSAVQIDHVVALSDSWQKGAQQWDTPKREAFANDPLNLLAADGPLNQQKGDGDAATWLPPNKAFRCAYVARQVGVKFTYGLWVTQAEQDAMVGVLSTCPTEPLPLGSAVPPLPVAETPEAVVVPPVVVPPVVEQPVVEQPVAPVVPVAPVAPSSGPFANCAEAWAAGAAPVHVGDPGYASKLDRDNDGVGCERRP